MKLRTLSREEAASELSAAESNYQLARQNAESYRQLRDETVLEAIHAGLSHSQIADATGLTRGRIGQIALGKR